MIEPGDVHETADGRSRVFVTRTTLDGEPFVSFAYLPFDGSYGSYHPPGARNEERFLADFPRRVGRMRINGLYQLLLREHRACREAEARASRLAEERAVLVAALDRAAFDVERFRAEALRARLATIARPRRRRWLRRPSA